jgi:hypothetical protein
MRSRALVALFSGVVSAAVVAFAAGSVAPASAQQGPGGATKPKYSGRQVMAARDWAAGDCTDVTRLSGLDGQSDTELDRMFGAPARKEAFRLGEKPDEFHVSLQNHYPLSVAANAKVQVQEWTWENGKCRLTVWLHKPAATWVVLENLRYPSDAEF